MRCSCSTTLTAVDHEITARCIAIMNRADRLEEQYVRAGEDVRLGAYRRLQRSCWPAPYYSDSWTFGTGFMDTKNLIAQEDEAHVVHAFSAIEMTFCSQINSIWADLSGGVDHVADISEITHPHLHHARRARSSDGQHHPRVNLRFDSLVLWTPETLENLAKLRDRPREGGRYP
ncbi:hypothetical protein PENSPDRAFT_648807 [Peniophora sp. CONT]|nr:hypothetical protein PENSPDRAFT_648807 [Peniophora sp. CONT]